MDTKKLYPAISGITDNPPEEFEATLTIIDEHGFMRGVVPDTPEVRAKFRARGFEVADGVATKQYRRSAKLTKEAGK